MPNPYKSAITKSSARAPLWSIRNLTTMRTTRMIANWTTNVPAEKHPLGFLSAFNATSAATNYEPQSTRYNRDTVEARCRGELKDGGSPVKVRRCAAAVVLTNEKSPNARSTNVCESIAYEHRRG